MPRVFTVVLVLTAILCAATARGQDVSAWIKVAPVNEEFTILMPKVANRSERVVYLREDWGERSRVYSADEGGVRYMVFSFDKKSAVENAPVVNFESFTEGFQHALRNLKRVRASVTSERTLGEDKGRQFLIQLGDYHGVARLAEGHSFFYAVMELGAEPNDATVSRWLDSFALGEKNSDPLRSGTTNENLQVGAASQADSGALIDHAWPTLADQPTRAIVTGGVLNGKVVSKPLPEYPSEAKAARAAGVVAVQILVDEEGKVVEAKAISGHPLLQEAAVKAARKARFSPAKLSGLPVKVRGVITYNFVLR